MDKSLEEKLNNMRQEINHELPIPNQDLNQKQNNISNNNVPVIRTFENDILDNVKNGNINTTNMLARELDNTTFTANDIYGEALKLERKRRIMKISAGVFAFLLLVGAFGYYYYVLTKPKPTVVTEVPVKKYYVADYFKNPTPKLIDYTGEATTTENLNNKILIINIKNFDNLYYYILNNESILSDVAKKYFNYVYISDFSDASIENIDLRISDGETGPMVYGFAGREHFLISNNIEYLIQNIQILEK